MDPEGFTDDGRRAWQEAEAEARRLRHNYIGTEHLLLGVLAVPDGRGAQALGALGVTLEAARGWAVRIVGRGEEATDGPIPWTPRAVTALTKRAPAAARRHGRPQVASEDVLLGVVALPGVGAAILRELGADRDRVRAQVARRVAGDD